MTEPQLSDAVWVGAIGLIIFGLALQIFGARPDLVEAAWRAAIVFMLVALRQEIREAQKKP